MMEPAIISHSVYKPPAIMRAAGSQSAFTDVRVDAAYSAAHLREQWLANQSKPSRAMTPFTSDTVSDIDLQFSLSSVLAERAQTLKMLGRRYLRDITFRRSLAIEDDIAVNEDSVTDFWSFLHSGSITRKGSIIFTGAGLLRITWRRSDDSHVALEFIGDETIRYVSFRKDAQSGIVFRSSGREKIEKIRRVVEGNGLGRLVFS